MKNNIGAMFGDVLLNALVFLSLTGIILACWKYVLIG